MHQRCLSVRISQRSGVPPLVRLLTQVATPQLMADEVVTIHTRRAEPGDDALPIRHGRRRARRIRIARRFLLRPGDAGLPEQLAIPHNAIKRIYSGGASGIQGKKRPASACRPNQFLQGWLASEREEALSSSFARRPLCAKVVPSPPFLARWP